MCASENLPSTTFSIILNLVGEDGYVINEYSRKLNRIKIIIADEGKRKHPKISQRDFW